MTDAASGATGPGLPALAVLSGPGVSVVLDVAGPSLPRVLHWGPVVGPGGDAGDGGALLAQAAVPSSFFDDLLGLPLLAGELDGWMGTPGVAGHRSGAGVHPAWTLDAPVDVTADGAGAGGSVVARASDAAAGLSVEVTLVVDPHGVVTLTSTLTATADGVYDVGGVSALMPLPPHALEVLDLTGRWGRERSPQRSPLQDGTHRHASRTGRSGHDAPLLLTAGTPGFGFRSGSVWCAHVAWSGDQAHLVERLPQGAGVNAAVIGGGELLSPGEVRLARGEAYTAPPVLFVFSDAGLDGASARVHRHLRARPGHPRSPRPVTLNTWEAVYFDHDLDRLKALADAAAALGVERYVLDDGWFRHRRDDSAGLGDWYVDEGVWPDGLAPLFDHVRSLGMQVGLWVEPEMVNPDSDLARAHPDWLLTARAPAARHQQVLDLANPETSAHLLERLDALVGENGVDFLKWDHNRDLVAPERAGSAGGAAWAGSHRQTLALYALLDALRERHPGLEVESCASGGGRVDLGILARTDRVWTSDCNDPLERASIQRWTSLLLPPELIGAHVGPLTSHTTGRTARLSFATAVALFGHAGVEWDVAALSAAEHEQLASFVALHRELRPLLHSGDVVRADPLDDGAQLHGVVAADRSQAVYAYEQLVTSPRARPGRVLLPGLDPSRTYRVRLRDAAHQPLNGGGTPPAWVGEPDGVLASGAVLGRVGLPMPVMAPASALLLHLTAG